MYEGNARALSAQNALGPFDVLPDHTNFMTLLVASELQVITTVDTRKFSIEHGILKVADNVVTVFANIWKILLITPGKTLCLYLLAR